MTRKILKQAVPVALVAALISAFFEWKRTPISILLGAALGLANHRALAWGVEGLLDSSGRWGKILFFSVLRLTLILLIVMVLLVLHVINLLGILIGFTVIFALILKEGFVQAGKQS